MVSYTPVEEQRHTLLRDRVHSTNAIRLEKRQHLDTLNTAMALLQQQIFAARTSYKAATQATVTAIDDQSKYATRLFADEIQARLPQEIRDMVYDLLWNEELAKYDLYRNERPWRANEVEHEMIESYPEGWCSEYGFPGNPREEALGPYPHKPFINPEFVGEEIAQEATQAFYRLAGGYVETLDEDCLEDYFRYDNFGVGVEPRKFITSITFFLDICSQVDKYPAYWRQRYDQVPTLELTDAGIESIFGSDAQHIAKITFLIKDENPQTALETLARSLPLYAQLKSVGASITVIYRYHQSYDQAHGYRAQSQSPAQVEPIDLGAILETPRDMWEDRMLQSCQQQRSESYPFVHVSIESYRQFKMEMDRYRQMYPIPGGPVP
ncbi:hypothetical protein EK21DRAFT_115328 [Setomelanomma holmii]|uniref:Uncharacterized protein n=1 Tax=Setomelanomma holmii TaxID=210430 RepID=A0A9P4LJT9_9PLEO|nr:hypothetical protein EK21DRAFT_115328 [Setomelanomma holmii]